MKQQLFVRPLFHIASSVRHLVLLSASSNRSQQLRQRRAVVSPRGREGESRDAADLIGRVDTSHDAQLVVLKHLQQITTHLRCASTTSHHHHTINSVSAPPRLTWILHLSTAAFLPVVEPDSATQYTAPPSKAAHRIKTHRPTCRGMSHATSPALTSF